MNNQFMACTFFHTENKSTFHTNNEIMRLHLIHHAQNNVMITYFNGRSPPCQQDNRNCRGQFHGITWNQASDVHRVSTLISLL